MLVINFCEKHNPTSITSGFSEKIVENIKNDIPMKMKDIVRIVIIYSPVKFTTLLIDRHTFENGGIQYKYHSKYYNENQHLDVFDSADDSIIDKDEFVWLFEKIKSSNYCTKCVIEYEKKYSLKLRENLITDLTAFIDYASQEGDDITFLNPETITHEFE